MVVLVLFGERHVVTNRAGLGLHLFEQTSDTLCHVVFQVIVGSNTVVLCARILGANVNTTLEH